MVSHSEDAERKVNSTNSRRHATEELLSRSYGYLCKERATLEGWPCERKGRLCSTLAKRAHTESTSQDQVRCRCATVQATLLWLAGPYLASLRKNYRATAPVAPTKDGGYRSLTIPGDSFGSLGCESDCGPARFRSGADSATDHPLNAGVVQHTQEYNWNSGKLQSMTGRHSATDCTLVDTEAQPCSCAGGTTAC